MAITSYAALWFLPFVLPICLYVAWSDLRTMKIPNRAVVTLLAVFVVIGLVAIPLAEYPWRLLNGLIVLAIGFVLNMARAFGAGDAKFCAAAAPFIAPDDGMFLLIIFTATLLGTWVTHRVAKYSVLKKLAPEWKSWSTGQDYPMGFALGGALGIYLLLGATQASWIPWLAQQEWIQALFG
ncbi:MAG: prepilin peptidase [Pseudomonadota bacterium]